MVMVLTEYVAAKQNTKLETLVSCARSPKDLKH
jgi:hypothetical protein